MIGELEIAVSYDPKSALMLDKAAQKHGSEAADRLVMTSAEQCSDLDQETARIRASGRVLRLQGEGMAKRGWIRNTRAASLCLPDQRVCSATWVDSSFRKAQHQDRAISTMPAVISRPPTILQVFAGCTGM
jgi:hypothetical protein